MKLRMPKLSIEQKDYIISASFLMLVAFVIAQYYIKNPFWFITVNTASLIIIAIVSWLYRSFFNKYQLFKAQPVLMAKVEELTNDKKENIRKIAELETEMRILKEKEKEMNK